MFKNNGYIKLYRKLLKNPIAQKPDYAWLWVTLLLKANHKKNKFVFNNEVHILNPGQLLTGRKKLSAETGIKESQVYKILKFLEKEQQIEQEKTNKYTIITVLNWDTYQVNDQQIEQQCDNKETTKKQSSNTYNNDNNEKNDKKYSPNSTEYKLSSFLYDKILENNPEHKKPNLNNWASHICKMIRLDKRDPQKIREIIEWCQADDFWHKNILSTDKLRKQYDRLIVSIKPKENWRTTQC